MFLNTNICNDIMHTSLISWVSNFIHIKCHICPKSLWMLLTHIFFSALFFSPIYESYPKLFLLPFILRNICWCFENLGKLSKKKKTTKHMENSICYGGVWGGHFPYVIMKDFYCILSHFRHFFPPYIPPRLPPHLPQPSPNICKILVKYKI